MALGSRQVPVGGSGRRAARRALIGIDLGATAARAAVLGDDPTHPVHLASVPLPAGAMVRGSVAESATVTMALRRLAADCKLNGRRVVVGVSTPQVVVRPLALPMMPPDKLRLALPYQARDVLPFPVTDALLDFSPLPATDAGGKERSANVMTRGLLTAAPRRSVMGIVQAVERAGMSVARVDLASFGMLRSVGSAGAAVEALVDVGAELTTIVIHRHGIPCVVRVVPFGGAQLTGRVADALGVDDALAESTKCSVGVEGDSAPALILRDELRTLVTEIRASLQYFAAGVGSTVDRVLLTGGTSRLPGLADLLARELQRIVDVGAPLRHVGGGDPGTASAVSIGLAMGMAA